MADSIVLACAHCQKLNRIPLSRLQEQPNCGSCSKPVFSDQPLNLDASSFTQQVFKSQGLIVVDFWAQWCGPCKMMAPVLQQAVVQLRPHFRIAKVDTEAQPALAQQFGIRSIPTLILFKDGRELDRLSGALPLPQFISWLQQHR